MNAHFYAGLLNTKNVFFLQNIIQVAPFVLIIFIFATNYQKTNHMSYPCENCKLRARYDNKPTSFVGRFWRWHINFCPGWKGYFKSLSEDEKLKLREKYQFQKY